MVLTSRTQNLRIDLQKTWRSMRTNSFNGVSHKLPQAALLNSASAQDS